MKIKSTDKIRIKLLGHFGEFKNSNSNYTVKFFSTYANNREKGSGSSLLLNELKPMRERVDPSRINDINSLLQRDLNDTRVAYELIPYLKGINEESISFFPAILAVLMPKGFLSASESEYPSAEIIEANENESEKLKYDEYWEIKKFLNDKGEETPLGSLEINHYETEIVVLDGQHRANAFRVLSDTFEAKEKSVYEAFYENIETDENYPSDLPVTLIWFESKNQAQIQPKLISRKLFIDVNSNARSVSESRQILLNDYDPSSVLTKYFYTLVADEYSFSPNEFSLLHSGFDIDSDLKYSSPHIFTLTIPQIVHSINEWLFFGREVDRNLDRYEVRRNPSSFTDFSNIAKILPTFRSKITGSEDEDSQYRKKISSSNDHLLINEYREIIFPIAKSLYNDHKLFISHYKACEKLQKARNETWLNDNKKEVWDKVFCGGEGLYYSFKNLRYSTGRISDKASNILAIIKEIENAFSESRAEMFDGIERERVDRAFKSIRTKAFQIGYFMSFWDYLNAKHADLSVENIDSSLKEFIHKLNDRSEKSWIYIFTELRDLIMGGDANPKKWPAYHKLLLRISQDENQFYALEKNKYYSPEAEAFRNLLSQKYDGYASSSGLLKNKIEYESIKTFIDDWVYTSKDVIYRLFEKCEIPIIHDIEWLKIAEQYFKKVTITENDSDIEESENE